MRIGHLNPYTMARPNCGANGSAVCKCDARSAALHISQDTHTIKVELFHAKMKRPGKSLQICSDYQ